MVKSSNPLFGITREPRIAEGDGGKDFVKYDLKEEEFDIPLFKATDKEVKTGTDGCVMFCNEGGKQLPVYEHVPHTKGDADLEFKKKHNLSSSSKPHRFVGVFVPLHKPRGKGLFPTEEAKNVSDFQDDFQTIDI